MKLDDRSVFQWIVVMCATQRDDTFFARVGLHHEALKPRGYHLLLQGLTAPLNTGSRLPATLVFEKAGTIDIEFLVEAPGPVGIFILDEHLPE